MKAKLGSRHPLTLVSLAVIAASSLSACTAQRGSESPAGAEPEFQSPFHTPGSAQFLWLRSAKKCVDARGNAGFNSSLGECADLPNAQLSNQALSGRNFRGANFRNANLGGADLRNADFVGADLSNANLFQGAKLQGALFNEETRLPFSIQMAESLGMKKASFESLDMELSNEVYGRRLRVTRSRGGQASEADAGSQELARIRSLLERQADANRASISELIFFAGQGDLELLKLLGRYGLDTTKRIRELFGYAYTKAPYAPEVTQMLVSMIREVNPDVSKSESPVASLIAVGLPLSVIETVLARGALVNVEDYSCRTVLHYAQNAETLELLMRYRKGAFQRNPLGRCDTARLPLLHYWTDPQNGSESDRIAMIRAAVRWGETVDSLDSHGSTALQYLLLNHPKLTIARTLIELGARVDVRDSKGNTLLHHLAEELVDLKGPNPSRSRFRTVSELSPAEFDGLGQLLIQSGTPATAQNSDGQTPLLLVSSRLPSPRASQKLELMLNWGVDMDLPDPSGRTAIFSIYPVVGAQDLARFVALLKKDVNSADSRGIRPIHQCRAIECVRAWIQLGANPKALTASGESLLHFAANSSFFRDSSEALVELLSLGVDPNAKTKPSNSHFFLDYYDFRGWDQKVFEAAVKAGLDFAAADAKGKTLIDRLNAKYDRRGLDAVRAAYSTRYKDDPRNAAKYISCVNPDLELHINLSNSNLVLHQFRGEVLSYRRKPGRTASLTESLSGALSGAITGLPGESNWDRLPETIETQLRQSDDAEGREYVLSMESNSTYRSGSGFKMRTRDWKTGTAEFQGQSDFNCQILSQPKYIYENRTRYFFDCGNDWIYLHDAGWTPGTAEIDVTRGVISPYRVAGYPIFDTHRGYSLSGSRNSGSSEYFIYIPNGFETAALGTELQILVNRRAIDREDGPMHKRLSCKLANFTEGSKPVKPTVSPPREAPAPQQGSEEAPKKKKRRFF